MSTLLSSVKGPVNLIPAIPSTLGLGDPLNHKTTKKNRHNTKSTSKYKQELWKQIDSSFITEECNSGKENHQQTQQTQQTSSGGAGARAALECVYRSSGQREHCD